MPLRDRVSNFLELVKNGSTSSSETQNNNNSKENQQENKKRKNISDNSSKEEEHTQLEIVQESKKRKTNEKVQSTTTPLTPFQKKVSRIEKQTKVFGSDTKAILNFHLKDLKKKFLTLNDLQALMLWSLMGHSCTTAKKKNNDNEIYEAVLFTPRWIHILNMGLIDKVVIVHLDSMSKEVFEKYQKSMPNLAKSMERYILADGIPSKRTPFLLVNPPWTKDQANMLMITEHRTANYWKKTFLHRLFKRGISFCKEKTTKKTSSSYQTSSNKPFSFATVSGTLNVLENSSKKNTKIRIEEETIEITEKLEVTLRDDIVQEDKEEQVDNNENENDQPKNGSSKETTLNDLLLSQEELSENNYPIFKDPTELESSGYVCTSNWKTPAKKYTLLALDCEMCLTKKGDELTRVTFVDEQGTVVYDKLVKPHEQIIDYRTMFSGITKEMLENVETRLEDVHKEVQEFISEDTILVGHSLENDLICLKIAHKRVIDTAVIFINASTLGTKYKQSLKHLTRKYLSREIQVNSIDKIGHDSSEDATAALDLVKVVLKEGIEYVHKRERRGTDFKGQQENVFEFLSNGEKRSVMVDRPYNLNGIVSGSLSDAIPCHSDEDVFQKSKKFVANSEYDLVFTHFSDLGTYYEKNDFDPIQDKDHPEGKKHDENIRAILSNLDNHFKELFQSASNNSLFIVTTGHGNISRLEREFKKEDKQKRAKEIINMIENCGGISFISMKE